MGQAATQSSAASAPDQLGSANSSVILWPEGAPDAVGKEPQDQPRIAVFDLKAPAAHPRTAVLVLPGGAYVALATDHEGRQVADWLNRRDVVAFVLTYRLSPRYHYPAPFEDATRAMRYIRSHAREYNINPAKIGIWGFSAGGHLASLMATHFDEGNATATEALDRASSRPDFAVLAYPVIEPLGSASAFSYESLLGKTPDPALVEQMKTDHFITTKTPPTFLFHTDSDDVVSPENSALFYLALKKAGVPGELHIYQKGPHGVGLAPNDPVLGMWPARVEDWLRVRGFIDASRRPSSNR